MNGLVTEFDELVGLGLVSDGENEYLFHCTQIAGGSRTIALGADVTFIVVEGRPKGPEAYEVTPV